MTVTLGPTNLGLDPRIWDVTSPAVGEDNRFHFFKQISSKLFLSDSLLLLLEWISSFTGRIAL
jgi:hypothetical protein